MPIASVNPINGETFKTFDHFSASQIERALQAADQAAAVMRESKIAQRQMWLKNAASILRKEKDVFAKQMTLEMGKTFAEAKSEVEKCAWVCDYYAEHGPAFLKPEKVATDNSVSEIRYLPIGPVLAVMPWNFPFWQVFRFAAPAIMCGNVGLLKHASNVPQSALLIADIWSRAGVPAGGFQTLLISGDQVADIIADERVRAVTLTGSEGAGRAVAETAGKNLKKAVLELGGSDPFIVMPSADLDDALEKAVTARTMNNGQSCIAAKRFIVHEDIYDAFTERFAAKLDALKVGDPMDAETDIGPLATEDIRNEIVKQVEDTISMGARRVAGAKQVPGAGWYFRPGILETIPPKSPAYTEELFGPVALMFKVQSIGDAIELANATRFGLGSAIFTQDESEMEQAFDGLDAGATFVNAITASDPRLPFGGVKASGYGRELAVNGLREFVNVKTCVIA